MFNWKKIGKIFDPTEVRDRPWLKTFAQGPCTLEFDSFLRIYFSCRPMPDENGQYVSYSGFVDVSKNNLFEVIRVSDQPILVLGAKGTFDEFGTYPVSVLRNGTDILSYYGGWTRCESVPFNVAIGMGVSKNNGISFEKAGSGPVLSYSPQEPFILSGPKIRKFNNIYYLFYIAGTKWLENGGKPEPLYQIRMAHSTDGITWAKSNKNLIETKITDEAQASPDVFFSNGRYHMFFCYRRGINYRGKDGGYRIGYAVSDNLTDWERQDDLAGISISQSGWDSEMVSYPHVFELNNKVWMLYLGNEVGKYGFGLAELEGKL